MVKIFTFKGYTVEQLKELSLDQFIELLPSKKKRSLKRGITEQQKILMKKAREHKGEKPIRTHVRNMVIIPEFLGKRFAVFDGKDWNIVEIKPEMLGHKLGEFSITRERVSHSGPGIGATRGTKFISVK